MTFTHVLSIVESGLDLVSEFTFGKLDIILGGTVLSHQVEETVVDVDELESIGRVR